MPLPTFTAVGTLNEVLGDVVSSELVQSAATRAVITLTCNHPSDTPIVWDGEINWVRQPIIARVNHLGEIVNEAGTPLLLIARDESITPDLQYRISIDLPPSVIPADPGERLRSWVFDARAEDVEYNLATDVPTLDIPAWRGPRGWGIASAAFDVDGNLVLTLEDSTVLPPIVVPPGTLVFVDNGDGTWSVGP